MDLLSDFSKALLLARTQKGATQEEVAWQLGLSHATYNAWECGHRLCPYKHVVALINFFNDEQFTRVMIRILLTLQHQMAGLDKMPYGELKTYYAELVRLMSEECESWLRTLSEE